MDSNDKSIQEVRQGIPVMLVAQPADESDINFADLWHTLVRNWRLVAVTLFASLLVGVAYLVVTPKTYKTEVSVMQPYFGDIYSLKTYASKYTPEMVFDEFSKQINLASVRRGFFVQYGVVKDFVPEGSTEQLRQNAFDWFNNSVTYSGGTLSVKGRDPEKIARWANALVEVAAAATRQSIAAGINTEIQAEKYKLKQSIDGMINTAALTQQDEITRMKESLSIAERLGIDSYDASAEKVRKPNSSVVAYELPTYMRGTKALRAELQALNERNNNDPAFIPGLRELHEMYSQLETSTMKADSFSVMRVEEPALAPDRPIKPKKMLVMLGAAVSGLMLGAFIALFSAAVRRSASARV